MSDLLFLTDFADLGVILPLLLVVCLTFVALGWQREARAWVIAISGTLGTMLLLKLAAFAAPMGHVAAGLSPSGHTAAGTVVYSGLLSLAARHPTRRIGLALAAGTLLAGLIGFTRLQVGEHSLPDVLIGALVGIAGALALAHLSGWRSPLPANARLAVGFAAVLAVLLVFHGQRLPAEARIRAIAGQVWTGGSP